MSELMERLDNLRALIQTPEFLEGKGLSNEVNIRIFCYDPNHVLYGMNFNHDRRKSAQKYKKRSDFSIASMSG